MRKWMPLVAVCLGTFMLLVDVTIVNVALPDMARDLSTSFSSLQWVIDAYALALAALLMGFGAAADRLGRTRVYLAGLVLFALASLASGLAPNAALLIAARSVQGIGGAAMFATTIALLNVSYRDRDRGIAFGVWGAVSGASAAAGPIIGGLLTQDVSWRWIFFVNLPVSVIAIVMTMRFFTERRAEAASRFDVAGVASFTVAASAATYALIRSSADGWTAGSTLGLLAVAAAALAGFVIIERRTPQPLIDLRLFASPSFSGVMIVALLINAAAFAYLVYTSLWLQTVLGLGPVEAGLTGAAPMSLAAFVVSILIGRHLHSSNPRWIIGGGMLLVASGALLQARLDAHSGWPELIAGLVVAGVGVGLATPTLVSTAMAAVPGRQAGMAAGAVNTARQLGYAFGIAVLGSAFSARITHVVTAHGGRSALAGAIARGQAQGVLASAPRPQYGTLSALVHAASASGLNAALAVAGGVGLVATIVAVALIRQPRDITDSRGSAAGGTAPALLPEPEGAGQAAAPAIAAGLGGSR
jgi:EmrB/QacA subfamily drug resistance transporter